MGAIRLSVFFFAILRVVAGKTCSIHARPWPDQGCQMVDLHTQKSQFSDTFEGLGMKKFGIHILKPFGVFYGHLVYILVIWYIFYHFCMLCKE
jgi:hypothetical protein